MKSKAVDPEFRKILHKSISNGLKARVLGLMITLISTPILLGEIGNEKFGLLILLTSVSGVLQIFDFGFPYLVANNLSQYQPTDMIGIYSHFHLNLVRTFKYLIAIFAIILLIFTLTIAFTSFKDQKISKLVVLEFTVSAVICAFVLILGNLASKVLLTQRKFSQLANLNLIGSLVGNLLALIAAFNGASVFIVGVLITIAPSLPCCLYVLTKLAQIRKAGTKLSISREAKFLSIRNSFPFLITNIGNVLFSYFDNIVLSIFLNLSSVAEYGIANKLFLLFYNLYLSAMQAVYSFFAYFFSQKDYKTLFESYKSVRRKAFLVAIVVFGLIVFFGEKLISLWTSNSLVPSSNLVFAFAAWTLICISGYPIAILFLITASSGEKVIIQSFAILLNLFGSIIATILLKTTYAPIIGSIISQLIGFYLPVIILLRQKFGENL